MKKSFEISESIELGIVLALAGGFMDAYSYICRGEVFANAQTGNILLFGVNLSSGNFKTAFTYFFPVMAFTIGIALSDIVRIKLKNKNLLHWRQISVFFEIIILFAVCFMPQNMNLVANCLTSLACGIQVESFRKIHGNGIATTMCIGNLRSGTQLISEYKFNKNKITLRRGLLYYFVIVCFVIGAIIGNICVEYFGEKALLFCCLILLFAFLMMFIKRKPTK